MNREIVLISCVLASLSLADAKPKITDKTGVRILAAVEDRTILARGSVFEVTGEAFGPAEPAASEIPHPIELSGVTVKLTSVADSSVAVDAYIVSASSARIVAILPSTAAAGDYRVTASFGGETSDPVQIKVADRNFGLVTNTGGFGGMAGARVLPEGADPVPVTLAAAVSPGATLEFDATGLGPIDAADNGLPPDANIVPDALLLIGTHEVPVTYLGRNPLKPGFDKLVVTLPAENLPASCVAVLKVKIGDVVTQSVSIPILGPEETACKHPMGISPEGLISLSNGGSIIRAGFTLVRLVGQTSAAGMTFEFKGDQFSGGFVRYTAADIAIMAASSLIASGYDENRCVVHDAQEGTAGGVYVDAGESLTLVDPSWSVSIPRSNTVATGLNQYNLVLDSKFNGAALPGVPIAGLLFNPGKHTLSGTGGSVIGPFSVDLEVSTQLQWTNMAEMTEIDTSKELVFLYSGAGADDVVTANGLVRGPAPEAPSKIVSRIWVCLAKGSDGRLTVPSSVLQKLPRVSAAELASSQSGRSSTMTLASYNPTGAGEFKAPLTEGGSTELTAFIFSYTYSKVPVPVK